MESGLESGLERKGKEPASVSWREANFILPVLGEDRGNRFNERDMEREKGAYFRERDKGICVEARKWQQQQQRKWASKEMTEWLYIQS